MKLPLGAEGFAATPDGLTHVTFARHFRQTRSALVRHAPTATNTFATEADLRAWLGVIPPRFCALCFRGATPE